MPLGKRTICSVHCVYFMARILFTIIAIFFLSSASSTTGHAQQEPLPAPAIAKGPGTDRLKKLTQGPTNRVKGEIVSGRIMIDGQEPMSGGRVAFFAEEYGPPSHFGNLRRIPERLSVIEQDGTFSLQLLAGRYYMGAMSRDWSMGPGPPQPGEKTYSAMDANNNLLLVAIANETETKLGPITVRHRDQSTNLQEVFTLIGTLKDSAGQPLEGAVVLVKINPRVRRPNFISKKTGPDGRFNIQLPAGRSYYLLAKDMVSAGRPKDGRLIGAYTGSDSVANIIPRPVPVAGMAGEIINDINITLIQLPNPEERKKKALGNPSITKKNGSSVTP